MWNSVKLHFSVSTNIKDFLKKSADCFRGFRIQFCFRILTLDVENTVLSKKVKNDFLRKMPFLTKNSVLGEFFKFSS